MSTREKLRCAAYRTLQDVLDKVIKPAVGPDADLYDLQVIAESMTKYRFDRDEAGRVTGGRGYYLWPEYDPEDPDWHDPRDWAYVLDSYRKETTR